MSKKKQAEVLHHQTSILNWFPQEKPKGAREVAIDFSHQEWKDVPYKRSTAPIPFPISLRNKRILEHLQEFGAAKPSDLGAKLTLQPKTIFIELEFLALYGMVIRC